MCFSSASLGARLINDVTPRRYFRINSASGAHVRSPLRFASFFYIFLLLKYSAQGLFFAFSFLLLSVRRQTDSKLCKKRARGRNLICGERVKRRRAQIAAQLHNPHAFSLPFIRTDVKSCTICNRSLLAPVYRIRCASCIAQIPIQNGCEL